MDFKTFVKRFRWWSVLPAALFFAVSIVLLALPAEDKLALPVAVGILLTLSGIVSAIAFFLGYHENPTRLLAGIVSLSAAIWLFITMNVSAYALGIAIAIIIALRAAGEILDAVLVRKESRWWIVRIVLAACFVGAAIVLPIDPFSTIGALLQYAGAVLLCLSVIETVITWCTGFLEKEEELVFRPVKKNKN